MNIDDSDHGNFEPETRPKTKVKVKSQTQNQVEKLKPDNSPSREDVLKRYSTTSVAKNATPTTTRSGRVSKPTQRLNLSLPQTRSPTFGETLNLNVEPRTIPDSWEDIGSN